MSEGTQRMFAIKKIKKKINLPSDKILFYNILIFPIDSFSWEISFGHNISCADWTSDFMFLINDFGDFYADITL